MILSPLSCINMIIGGRHRSVPPDHHQPSVSGALGQTKTRGGVSPGAVSLAPGFSIATGTQLISN